MSLILHTPDHTGELIDSYRRAMANAVELFIVTAFLTEWDASLTLNADCRKFRVIIGKDFGITKKAACTALMKWLPPKRKGQFMVADRISGFHPKMAFWKDSTGRAFAIVGSSNLTRAAFETNYEANIYCPLTSTEYEHAKAWITRIEKQSVVVSEDWLDQYKEMPPSRRHLSPQPIADKPNKTPIVSFKLPRPAGTAKLIADRRKQLAAYKKNRAQLMHLFRACADGSIDSNEFYTELPKYWSYIGLRSGEVYKRHAGFDA